MRKCQNKTVAENLTESLFGDMSKTLPESNETIEDIRADIGNCTRCPLCEGRTKIVHSTGNFNADLMFVGEAPGADEDAQGVPFVGRAGQLLDKIIESYRNEAQRYFHRQHQSLPSAAKSSADIQSEARHLQAVFNARNCRCPPESNCRAGKYGDEKSARTQKRNHQIAWEFFKIITA